MSKFKADLTFLFLLTTSLLNIPAEASSLTPYGNTKRM